MRRTLTLALVLLPWAAFAQPPAEPMDFVREKSAQQYGQVRPNERIVLAPLAPGPGLVFAQPFFYGGSVRLHFRIDAPPSKGDWTIRIVDQGATVWETSAKDGEGSDFWSEEASGKATIEIHTTEASAGLQLTVDKIAVAPSAHFVNQATTPPRDCKTPIDTMAPPPGCHAVDAATAARIKSWSDSVARLRLVAADDNLYYCSGFLIAPDLLLTNWHCVQSLDEMRATRVDFGYDKAGVKPTTLRVKEWILPNKSPYDFVILRLTEKVPRPRLALVDKAPGTDLVVIQHPDGLPKHVSVEDCKVTNRSIAGVDRTKLTDFGHFCDTLGGSSGSPVIDAATGDVVGLHHLGFKPGSQTPYNQAIAIGQILATIQEQRGDVFAEIKGGTP